MPFHWGKGEQLLKKKSCALISSFRWIQFIQMNSEISVRDDLLIDVEISL